MSVKLDKKTREALELKKQLQRKKREELRKKKREEKAKQKLHEELENARLEALKDLLDPTKEELEHAASDMHTYQTIVKLMFPKQDELDDGALNIFNIFMTKKTAKPLLSNIVNSSIVHTLDLSKMFLRDNIGLLIANCLKRNKCIKVLCLNNNLFTSITAGAIGEALMENKTLKNLSLEYNKNITRKKNKNKNKKKEKHNTMRNNNNGNGMKLLAKSLSKNNTILTLNLTYCNLTSDDGVNFASSVKENKSLISLDISLGNPNINFIDLESICNVVNRNYQVILKQEEIEKKKFEENEPQRHKRYLEIKEEQEMSKMQSEIDKKIEEMVLKEEKKMKNEMRYKKSLELAQLRDAGERERYRLRRVANSKDNGDNKKKNKERGRKQKTKKKR